MILITQPALSHDDVLLVPRQFTGQSRDEIHTRTSLCGLNLSIPLISANMASITELDMADAMSRDGGIGIFHRVGADATDPIHLQNYRTIARVGWSNNLVGASFGLNVRPSELEDLVEGASILCLDVAHADQTRVIKICMEFREKYPKFPLIVGNIATPGLIGTFKSIPILRATLDVTAFKVGIGSSSVCSTRIQTGCGLPTFQSLIDINEVHPDVQIIADGGHKTPGDVVKSLAIPNVKAVMLGSLLAGTDECPGSLTMINGNKYKSYYGNASVQAKGAVYVEGISTQVPYKGPVHDVLNAVMEGVRSGMSYCGAMTLVDLKDNAYFKQVTSAGHRESTPYGAR